MRIKYVIVGVLLLGGVLFGSWNWMRYFKMNRSPASKIEALRPVPKAEQEFKARNDAPDTARRADTSAAQPLKIPEKLGRNPFLTLEEAEALARGMVPETAEPTATSTEQAPAVNLPTVRVQGLIQDNVTGNYLAIIDGKNYGRGDMLGEEKIAAITRQSVILELDGRTREIKVGSPEDTLSGGMRIIRKKP